jgi:hypothetical protein
MLIQYFKGTLCILNMEAYLSGRLLYDPFTQMRACRIGTVIYSKSQVEDMLHIWTAENKMKKLCIFNSMNIQ